jgi:hypothetical protein
VERADVRQGWARRRLFVWAIPVAASEWKAETGFAFASPERRAYSLLMATRYETDVIAWANEQAAFLRAGNFSALDIEHIADEVEDVGKSEQRELESRMAVLLCHLLKWQFQPERRGASWEATIHVQREGASLRIQLTPSLKYSLSKTIWWQLAWVDAVEQAIKETGLNEFPTACPWVLDQILDQSFFPD